MELQEAIRLVKGRYTLGSPTSEVERINSERDVIKRFGSMFNPSNLDQLTAQDFMSFLQYENNCHWGGINLQGDRISLDMLKLRATLKLLLDESKSIKERLDILIPKNETNFIKGLGKSILTPILLVVYPEKYSVCNKFTIEGMKKFGIYPRFKHESFAEKYVAINEIIINLAKRNGLTLWQIDEVWSEVCSG